MQDAAPILGEQSLLVMVGAVLAFAGLFSVCVTLALRNNPDLGRHLLGAGTLHIITVLAVVFAAAILALERVLTGEAVATLLGGIVGYVLGSLKSGSGIPPSAEGDRRP